MSDRPITDFEWITQLDEAKGLVVGSTYRNNNSAKVFLCAIAEQEKRKVAEAIKHCDFACIIGDGSTDSSTNEQEMWFLRTCKDGHINIYFVGVFSPDKANAENIVVGIKELLKTLKIDWADVINKLVGLSCDGASVMTGIKSGLGALLRKENPMILTIHCLAHRLELALKNMSKKCPLYRKTVDTLLLGLYLFYHDSSLNRAMLVRSMR
ncbi:hypothetical protein FSP39_024949 [Pinctada imbricata]|uniref:DUF4371 domain-containing protein n=1 Tax=Pinctada imbricata TaxID=66713 RepID=A0AA89C2U2_PINIB|nr:hypothetical protein FSP39_024949 [Pinctada imbricata]